MLQEKRKVISASRRVEMVGFYPDLLCDILDQRCPPEKVHTIVLWSKKPEILLSHQRLQETLKKYDQLFLHLTITGMGGTLLEPGIPKTDDTLSILPDLIHFIGSPRNVRIRFDPVVHVKFQDGTIHSNLSQFDAIAHVVQNLGLREIIISWMTLYPKVMKRLKKAGIEPIEISAEEKKNQRIELQQMADKLGIQLIGCCDSDLPVSSCIDGKLLNLLHPKRVRATTEKASGQREHCGCTKSWDIGWYYPCPGGCLYCYANPKISAL